MAIRLSNIISLAKKEAEKSVYRFRLGAVIYRKKEIISVGHNNPFGNCPRVLDKYKRFPTSIHAEVAAIINARTDLTGATLVVVRLNRHGELMHSLPCVHCFSYIVYVGIKKIVYVTEMGEISQMKISSSGASV